MTRCRGHVGHLRRRDGRGTGGWLTSLVSWLSQLPSVGVQPSALSISNRSDLWAIFTLIRPKGVAEAVRISALLAFRQIIIRNSTSWSGLSQHRDARISRDSRR